MHKRQQVVFFLQLINLINRQYHGGRFGQDVEHGFILRREFHRFNHPHHDINFAQGLRDIAVEHAVERATVFGLKSRGIDKNVLGVVLRQYAIDAVARGLGFFRGDGHFRTDELIHQGGFADIRTTDDGDKACMEWGCGGCGMCRHGVFR